jgi:predicted ATPase/DNA-binding winged helix-turn-helix (wHTH) protein
MSFSAAETPSHVVSFGAFRLYAKSRRLEKHGVPVEIGSRALDILIVLVERAGESVSKRELLARVWRDMIVEESSLRVNISGLRRVLGDGRDGMRYVTNIPGQGYCFVAPLSRTVLPGTTAPGQETPTPQTSSLPRRLSRMVGRNDQVLVLAVAVLNNRFVTIAGPGGIGKTTTAVAVAHSLLPQFGDAVCFFDLSALSAPALLAGTMAATLGITMAAASDPVSSLITWLQDKKMLLVLDSCEHLIEAVATLTETLYDVAPGVHILATSRETLRAEGEFVYRLPPLEAPPAESALTAEQALSFPAVQLFVDRAAVDGHSFELADADAPLVADICRKLDGIALAIELGAGRVQAFGVRGTADLLDDRFILSWNGRRTALPRHQTLNAMLDWSYQLLSESERTVLCQLASMTGRFSLEAVRGVAADAGIDEQLVTDVVASLVAKSLVLTDQRERDLNYRLLDTVRIYALEKLRLAGSTVAAGARPCAAVV